MLGIFCKSSTCLKMNLNGQYHQDSSILEGSLPRSIATFKENLNLLGKVDLHLNGFINVNNLESIAAKYVILLPKNDENLMMLNLFMKMIMKNEYHCICIPKGNESKGEATTLPGLYKLQVMPSLHTSLPSIVFMLDWTSKVYINSNKYCFVTSNGVFLGYLTNPQSVTLDKGKIKTIRDMKTVTSIYLIESYFGLASFSR